MDTFLYELLREPLTLLVTAILMAVAGILTNAASKLLGQQTANKLQQAFQAAAERAAALVIMEIGRRLGASPMESAFRDGTVDQVIRDVGVKYMEETMPGTISKLGANVPTIEKIVKANVGKQLQK